MLPGKVVGDGDLPRQDGARPRSHIRIIELHHGRVLSGRWAQP